MPKRAALLILSVLLCCAACSKPQPQPTLAPPAGGYVSPTPKTSPSEQSQPSADGGHIRDFPSVIPAHTNPPIGDSKVFAVGEDIDYSNFEGTIRFNVKSVKTFTNIFDAGLKLEDLYTFPSHMISDADMADADADMADADGNLGDRGLVVLLTITAANIDYKGRDDEAHLSVMDIYYNPDADEGSCNPVSISMQTFYFLNSEHPNGSSEYYHYKLAVGQTKELLVAWIVDIKQFSPSKLFLWIGTGGYTADPDGNTTEYESQFVDLGLGE